MGGYTAIERNGLERDWKLLTDRLVKLETIVCEQQKELLDLQDQLDQLKVKKGYTPK